MNAVEKMPYFATIVYSLVPVCVPGLGTFASDEDWRVYIDPETLRKWGPSQSGAVLLHEVEHCLREHGERRRSHGADGPNRWNVAADCEINDDLVKAEVDLPDSMVLPRHFGLPDGRLVEFYYDALPPLAEDRETCAQCEGSGAGRSSSGPDREGRDEQGRPGSRIREVETGSETGGGVCAACGGEGQSHRRCGSAAGNPVPGELPPDDPSFPGRNDATKDLARRRVAEAIQDPVLSSQKHGKAPDGLQRWAREHLRPPQVSWQQLLRGAIHQAINVRAGQLDYSYRRPGRRRIPRVVTPAMTQPVPKVATIIDTSASMRVEQLVAALSEVEAICQRAGLRGDNHVVLTVDAETHGARRVSRAADVDLVGGGGTDMARGIADAAQLRPRPDIIVVLTDGATEWPTAQPPRCKVIIGLVGSVGDIASVRVSVPEWAAVVEIPI